MESWVTKYDAELGELRKEMDEVVFSHRSEKCRMREIEDHFDRHRLEEGGAVLAAADAILVAGVSTAHALLHARRCYGGTAPLTAAPWGWLCLQDELAKVRRVADAAVMIQSAMRSHLLRKELKEKSSKKGKGKGKGKKKVPNTRVVS